MRRVLLAFALLAACQITAPDEAGLTGLPQDDISVTSLDAAPGDVPTPLPEGGQDDTATDDAVAPVAEDPAPEDASEDPPPAEEPAADEPQAPKSAEQILCEKTGGQWAVAGKSGAFSCIKPTRDAGKSCRKKGDCQGMCLARSGTCAPFMPLFGCNEVLEKDGRRVTLCID